MPGIITIGVVNITMTFTLVVRYYANFLLATFIRMILYVKRGSELMLVIRLNQMYWKLSLLINEKIHKIVVFFVNFTK